MFETRTFKTATLPKLLSKDSVPALPSGPWNCLALREQGRSQDAIRRGRNTNVDLYRWLPSPKNVVRELNRNVSAANLVVWHPYLAGV